MTDLMPDAMAALRTSYRALPLSLSRLLRAEAPDFFVAVENVLMLTGQGTGTAHITPEPLQEGDRAPEDIPSELFFDSSFDTVAPRHLGDVWGGAGDVGDPFVPVTAEDHELALQHLRENGVDSSAPAE